ncbi:peptidoglycan editing factor PgeF [Nitrosomonadales bacterium]|nr:peptidoglycan editing factor PgeF [Nitrosomonadales bacterium]
MNKDFIYPDWSIPIPTNIKAIQTTRIGGVSRGEYSSLNLSNKVGDKEQNLNDNLEILLKELPSLPSWPNQIHSNKVRELKKVIQPFEEDDKIIQQNEDYLNCDAVYTFEKKNICAVRTADCLPILLTNKGGDFVAAIHGGWRGLGADIIKNTIDELSNEYKTRSSKSSDMLAWLGPCISSDNYRVDQEVVDYFISNVEDFDSISSTFKPIRSIHDGLKFELSLKSIAFYQLQNQGLLAKNITGNYSDSYPGSGLCTYDQKDKFYSYRRDGVTGRMATLIWME